VKILYGVVGEGMGHAMRSRVVLDRLIELGHEVEIMASGRAKDYLAKRFEGVHKIHGLHMIYEENRVRRGKTLWSNVLGAAGGLPSNIAAYFKLIDDFAPQLVISDFESWTYVYAKLHGLPIVSIDNMQIINRCKLPKEITKGHTAAFELTRAFVKGKLPNCDEYLITSFFRPKIRKKRTRIVPPILRPEIIAAKTSNGEHLLVYQTGEGNEGLAKVLAATGIECRVYGMRRDLTAEQVEGNLRYQPFSEDVFIENLASCRGVVAGGGFTLMGEAVYMHKPMLAVPLGLQFEQVLNGRYLASEGYGATAPTLDDPAVVHGFVKRLDEYAAKLAGYEQKGNDELYAAMDEVLDKAEAGLLDQTLI
jgi:uncharacterized protein (TIGR00661 family)